MSREQPFLQHRTHAAFHRQPRLVVHARQWKACGEKRIRRRLIDTRRAVTDRKTQPLRRVFAILKEDKRRYRPYTVSDLDAEIGNAQRLYPQGKPCGVKSPAIEAYFEYREYFGNIPGRMRVRTTMNLGENARRS
jgi:hypothetical protein